MDPSVYRAAKPIFDAASDLPAAERTAYVVAACGENRVLRQLVENLLATDGAATDGAAPHGGEVDGRPLAALDRATERTLAIGEEPGVTIDRFELQERIGEGGFGTVWRAEQLEPVRRHVAVKVLKPGMDTRKVVARFEAERQALALMDHPSIAQVYDGGATSSGRPYFAMELVDGVPVTEFCRAADLDLQGRLDLFAKTCGAIQHAHQKGVIHRDVKPSNVLVTRHEGRPFPKVIDFGIAKAVTREPGEATQLTEEHQIIGTPEYMAPEQLDGGGRGIDTRADVYALGVLLYELLTETRPFEDDSAGRGLSALLDAIRSEEPEKPSTRTLRRQGAGANGATQRMRGALRGDLDWIVLRALAKDRRERYESVGDLAADIRRHLRNEPVLAGPPSTVYRVRKFVARNRGFVVASGLVFLALVAGLIGTLTSLDWALEEKARAEQRFELALDAVDDYHTGIAEDVVLQRPELASLRNRLLGAPRRFYEQLERSLAADARPEERAELARAVESLARLQAMVGEDAAAIGSYRRAADLLGLITARPGASIEHRWRRARVLGVLGALQISVGQGESAVRLLRQAIAVVRTLALENAEDPRFSRQLADLRVELGSALRQRGEAAAAEAEWREALSLLEHQRAAAAAAGGDGRNLALLERTMGGLALTLGEFGRARELFASGQVTLDRLLKDSPDSAFLQRALADCASDLGQACVQVDDSKAAKAAFERAVELEEGILAAYPAIQEYRSSLGDTTSRLARVCAGLGQHSTAARLYDRSVDLLVDARSVSDRRILARACDMAANYLVERDDLGGAIERYARAVAAFDSVIGESDDPELLAVAASYFNNYAGLVKQEGDLAQAMDLYGRSIEVREQALDGNGGDPIEHLNLGTALVNLARMHFDARALADALPLYTRAVEVLEGVAEEFDRATDERFFKIYRASHWGRANTHQQGRDYGMAVADWLRAAEIDGGKMRSSYLVQALADTERAGELSDLPAIVARFDASTGATAQDLFEVAEAFLKARGDHSAYLPIASAVASHAAIRTEAAKNDDSWRFSLLLARVLLAGDDADGAIAAQERALGLMPDDVSESIRVTEERRLGRMQQRRDG